jgi:hypothetical protein
MFYEEHHVHVKECFTRPYQVETNPSVAYPRHAFVLNLPSKIEAFRARNRFLNTFGINLQRWPAVNGSASFNASDYSSFFDENGKEVFTWFDRSRKVMTHRGANDGYLTMGERGYLESMKRLFTHALSKKEIQTLMVLDEDVIFDCNLKARLLDVLSSGRCGGPVALDSKDGGVLILGASIWVDQVAGRLGGWSLTNVDIAEASQQFGQSPRCFNAHSKVFGSYAVIYHRSTFANIIEWIKRTRKPFDHIYPHLYSKKHVVRVAYPFVAIQDVGHESTVDTRGNLQSNITHRARLHHWQLHRYCFPDFSPVLTELVL